MPDRSEPGDECAASGAGGGRAFAVGDEVLVRARVMALIEPDPDFLPALQVRFTNFIQPTGGARYVPVAVQDVRPVEGNT